MIKYTFTFSPEQESKFKNVLARLDPEEYNVLEEIRLMKPDEPRYSDRQTIIEMEPEACLTFRLGMKEVKIRRERSEEELAEEKAIDDQNTVSITIKVNGMPGPMTP